MAELGLQLAQRGELVQAELTLLRLTLQVLCLLLQAPPLLNILNILKETVSQKSKKLYNVAESRNDFCSFLRRRSSCASKQT
jgi:hypothetical protein